MTSAGAPTRPPPSVFGGGKSNSFSGTLTQHHPRDGPHSVCKALSQEASGRAQAHAVDGKQSHGLVRAGLGSIKSDIPEVPVTAQ